MQGLHEKKGMDATDVTDYTTQAPHKCCGRKKMSKKVPHVVDVKNA